MFLTYSVYYMPSKINSNKNDNIHFLVWPEKIVFQTQKNEAEGVWNKKLCTEIAWFRIIWMPKNEMLELKLKLFILFQDNKSFFFISTSFSSLSYCFWIQKMV